MSDFDERARAAGERIRREAAAIAATVDPREFTGGRSGGHQRGLLVAAAAAAAVIAGVVGLLFAGGRNLSDLGGVGSTTADTADTDPAPASTTPVSTTSVAAPVVVETSTTTVPEPSSITRPIVDPAVCEPVSAADGSPSGLPRDVSSTLPLTLFARPSELPIPIQIIAASVDGQAEPFALVQRYLDRDRQLVSPDSIVSINGIDTFVATYPNGNGEVEWTLDDGSTGYLRSRGLDRDRLVAIAGQLTPRPADAAIPGFDYGSQGPAGLALVAEAMNTDVRRGAFAGSQCRVASTGSVYRIGAFTGDPVLTYAAVIDRPPPVDVGVIGDAVIVISGISDPLAPTVGDVVDADEATWRRLLVASEPEFESAQLIGGESAVIVELVPIDDTSTPVGLLTLRIDEQDGVAFLEVYRSEAMIADAAEYWKIEIDGRLRGRSSVFPGDGRGVSGTRLGDAADQTGREFTVRISTTDGDDQTVQTTGEVRLLSS